MYDHTLLADLLPEIAAGLLVAAAGIYYWRRSHADRAPGTGFRQKAAESLWAKLEDVNFGMRETKPGNRPNNMSAHLQDLNMVLRKNSPYLDESVQATVSAYVNALHRVADLLRDNNGQASVDWADSAILPIASGNPALVSALQDLARQREIVKGALLKVPG